MEPWWNPGGTLVELWWNRRGTLPQGRPGPPRSLSGLRPQSFQLLGKNTLEPESAPTKATPKPMEIISKADIRIHISTATPILLEIQNWILKDLLEVWLFPSRLAMGPVPEPSHPSIPRGKTLRRLGICQQQSKVHFGTTLGGKNLAFRSPLLKMNRTTRSRPSHGQAAHSRALHVVPAASAGHHAKLAVHERSYCQTSWVNLRCLIQGSGLMITRGHETKNKHAQPNWQPLASFGKNGILDDRFVQPR